MSEYVCSCIVDEEILQAALVSYRPRAETPSFLPGENVPPPSRHESPQEISRELRRCISEPLYNCRYDVDDTFFRVAGL